MNLINFSFHSINNCWIFLDLTPNFDRYGSETSDLAMSRIQTDTLSPSPIPHAPNSITEVDAINNNRNVEPHLSRKSGLGTCENQYKSDIHLKISTSRRQQQQQHQNIHDPTYAPPIDSRLNDWLNTTNIDPISKNAILAEQFTFDDFIYGMEKSDLYRIGLK